jgi:hypothetical protein
MFAQLRRPPDLAAAVPGVSSPRLDARTQKLMNVKSVEKPRGFWPVFKVVAFICGSRRIAVANQNQCCLNGSVALRAKNAILLSRFAADWVRKRNLACAGPPCLWRLNRLNGGLSSSRWFPEVFWEPSASLLWPRRRAR